VDEKCEKFGRSLDLSLFLDHTIIGTFRGKAYMEPESDEHRARIGELLLLADLITELQLRKALEIQKNSGALIINVDGRPQNR